jgi:hypothetical protein
MAEKIVKTYNVKLAVNWYESDTEESFTKKVMESLDMLKESVLKDLSSNFTEFELER